MKIEQSFGMLENEFWWGGVVHQGHQMPLGPKSHATVEPGSKNDLDQSAPLFLSSKGRLLWSESDFAVHADGATLHCLGNGDIHMEEGHGTLRGAYLAACKAHLPFPCGMPDARFFSRPQYNTWIELETGQTEEGILAYARGLLEQGMQPGILMIDEGWAEEYGVFEFNRRKIPNPKALIASLHEMGFAVMLWVTPLVACAGPRFLQLQKAEYLLKDREGNVAIREWWNGYSAVLDLTNPQAYAWLDKELRGLMDAYGVDGFKFDAGDHYFYQEDDQMHRPVPVKEQTRLYNQLGEGYAFNEFRAAWNFGGHRIVARLQDKLHTWDTDGLRSLIPNTLLQGLLGYVYCCPDMVGGGDIGSFRDGQPMDGELFVRWAQASACMGMIQMSISPWRILSEEQAALVVEAIRLHASLADTIQGLAKHASETGEPIVRHMAYVFPEEGFEEVSDQFMLGDNLLVCPVLEKGATKRTLRLPMGQWKSWQGQVLEGGKEVEVAVTLRDIPRLERLQ